MNNINAISQLKPVSTFNATYSEKGEAVKNQIFTAEVVDIILDSSHPKYKEPRDIGNIVFYSYNGPNGIAKPLNGYNEIIPLKHESVLIISSAVETTNIQPSTTGFYYFNPIGVFGIVNFNPTPYSTAVEPQSNSKSKSYSEFSGNTQSENKKPPEFGKYFESKSNIPSLQPFEGDVILQGRWGNTIRFGSISTGKNSWSTGGKQGDPNILISVNGQQKSDLQHRVEDILNDASSIYLCENAKIDVKRGNELKKSLSISKAKVVDQSKYTGNQIIISSDRLLFQSKSDSIFLTAKNIIHLTTTNSINFDANSVAMRTDKSIVLDSKQIIIDAEELFLKGKIEGTPRFQIGKTTTFTTFDGKVIQVTNGLITGVS